jgi:hypothetical protein
VLFSAPITPPSFLRDFNRAKAFKMELFMGINGGLLFHGCNTPFVFKC